MVSSMMKIEKKMIQSTIHNAEELEQLVVRCGFLPFFRNSISGFSIEECTSPGLWFEDGVDGPWEWKGPVIRNWTCTYGKFFCGKAGFVSMEWFPDFANYRRSKFSFDCSPLDKEGKNREKTVYDTVVGHESLLSKEIKSLCGFRKPKTICTNPMEQLFTKTKGCIPEESFETVLTRLQMATLIVVADFEYQLDRHGQPYGWGIARYTTPEALFGDGIALPDRTPEESKARILCHLRQILPSATEERLLKFIG